MSARAVIISFLFCRKWDRLKKIPHVQHAGLLTSRKKCPHSVSLLQAMIFHLLLPFLVLAEGAVEAIIHPAEPCVQTTIWQQENLDIDITS